MNMISNMPGLVAGNLSNFSIGSQSNSERPQNMDQVVDKLADMLKGSDLSSSPLGQMVKDKLDDSGGLMGILKKGGMENAVKDALKDIISEKLGDNFGAAQSLGLGNGSGTGGAGGAGGGQQPDLLERVLSGLAKSSLDDLLGKQGEGTTFDKKDIPLLTEIAKFMDDPKNGIKPPDSGTWANELHEDNYLNKEETADFRAALDQIGGALSQKASGQPSGMPGGLGMPGNAGQNMLGGEGGLGGSGTGSAAGNPLQQLNDLIQGLQGLASQLSLQNLASSAMDTANALVGAMLPNNSRTA